MLYRGYYESGDTHRGDGDRFEGHDHTGGPIGDVDVRPDFPYQIRSVSELRPDATVVEIHRYPDGCEDVMGSMRIFKLDARISDSLRELVFTVANTEPAEDAMVVAYTVEDGGVTYYRTEYYVSLSLMPNSEGGWNSSNYLRWAD